MGTIYKLPADKGEFEAILAGKETCTIRINRGNNVEQGDLILEELDKKGEKTGRYLKVHVDHVRPTIIKNVTNQEVEKNGISGEYLDKLLASTRSINADNNPILDRAISNAEASPGQFGEPKIAFLMAMHERHPNLPLNWDTRVNAISFFRPRVIDKDEAERIIADRKASAKEPLVRA